MAAEETRPDTAHILTWLDKKTIPYTRAMSGTENALVITRKDKGTFTLVEETDEGILWGWRYYPERDGPPVPAAMSCALGLDIGMSPYLDDILDALHTWWATPAPPPGPDKGPQPIPSPQTATSRRSRAWDGPPQ